MGYPREIYQQASAVLSARRQQANEQTLMHRREIYALLPQMCIRDSHKSEDSFLAEREGFTPLPLA